MTVQRPVERAVPAGVPSPRPTAGRNRALDGLRGLAVIAVVLRHLEVAGFDGGGTGVFLFFVLSGFLITELLCAELVSSGRIALGAFWARRAYRLLPAFGATVVLAVLLAAVLGDAPGHVARQSLPAVLYVGNWWRVHELTSTGVLDLGPFQHTWSLSVEEQFYLFWPPLLLLLVTVCRRRLGIVAGVTALLALASVADRMVVWDHARPLLSAALVYNRTDTEAVLLLTGAVAGILLHVRPASTMPGPRWQWVGAGCVVVLVVLAAGQPLTASRHLELWWTAGALAFAVVAAVLCVVVVRSPTAGLARALGWAPLAGVGRISYGVYLYHYPLVVLLAPRFGRAAGDLLVIGCTFALATVSWFGLERPILRAHRHRARPASQLTTAT